MISRQQLTNFMNKDAKEHPSPEEWLCWNCKKVGYKEQMYVICMSRSSYTLRFHEECWEEIAGDEYTMELVKEAEND